MEVWKDVPGYEGRYQVSDFGRVKSLPKRRGRGKGYLYAEAFLAPSIHHHGYAQVHLRKNGKGKSIFVHRLVASAFISNSEGKEQINHINGDKTDNRLENLEWCTNGENQLHKYRVLGCKPYGKPVVCLESGETYSSEVAAGKHLGVDSSCIAKCCNGKRKIAGGFHWRYAE